MAKAKMKLPTKYDKSWWEQYEALKRYKMVYGRTNVPRSVGTLGFWVDNQRRYYKAKKDGKKSTLTDEREAALRVLGFVFDPSKGPGGTEDEKKDSQRLVLRLLRQQSSSSTSSSTSTSSSSNSSLSSSSSSSCSKRQSAWMLKFEELKNYKTEHGDTNVPKNHGDGVLGRWVNKQRTSYHRKLKGMKSPLNDERVVALNSINFAWSLKKKSTSTRPDASHSKNYNNSTGGGRFGTDLYGHDSLNDVRHGHKSLDHYPAATSSWLDYQPTQYEVLKDNVKRIPLSNGQDAALYSSCSTSSQNRHYHLYHHHQQQQQPHHALKHQLHPEWMMKSDEYNHNPNPDRVHDDHQHTVVPPFSSAGTQHVPGIHTYCKWRGEEMTLNELLMQKKAQQEQVIYMNDNSATAILVQNNRVLNERFQPGMMPQPQSQHHHDPRMKAAYESNPYSYSLQLDDVNHRGSMTRRSRWGAAEGTWTETFDF